MGKSGSTKKTAVKVFLSPALTGHFTPRSQPLGSGTGTGTGMSEIVAVISTSKELVATSKMIKERDYDCVDLSQFNLRKL